MSWHRKRPAVFSGFTKRFRNDCGLIKAFWLSRISVYTNCETVLTEKICIANPQ